MAAWGSLPLLGRPSMTAACVNEACTLRLRHKVVHKNARNFCHGVGLRAEFKAAPTAGTAPRLTGDHRAAAARRGGPSEPWRCHSSTARAERPPPARALTAGGGAPRRGRGVRDAPRRPCRYWLPPLARVRRAGRAVARWREVAAVAAAAWRRSRRGRWCGRRALGLRRASCAPCSRCPRSPTPPCASSSAAITTRRTARTRGWPPASSSAPAPSSASWRGHRVGAGPAP